MHLHARRQDTARRRMLSDSAAARMRTGAPEPLDHASQQFSKPRFRFAFSHVRVHAAPLTVFRQKADKEAKERAKILVEFTDGAGLSEQRVSQIASAMNDFSLRQLRAMRKAGVRFWAPDSLPPEFKDRVEVENISTPGEYLDVIRVIRIAEKATTDQIRHELAHAWDHVRTGKVRPIARLKGAAFEKAIMSTPPLVSETNKKLAAMFQSYTRWRLREQSFDNPSTRQGHSKTSVREFYAEGYSVFHGAHVDSQARLLYYAPELYELLETEAKAERLPVPDRTAVEASIKEQKLPP